MTDVEDLLHELRDAVVVDARLRPDAARAAWATARRTRRVRRTGSIVGIAVLIVGLGVLVHPPGSGRGAVRNGPAGVAAARSLPGSSNPYTVPRPPSIQAADSPGCRSTVNLPASSGSDRPSVSPNPTGVDIVWLSGLNPPCRTSAQSHLDAQQAQALAVAVDAAPPFPNGPINCPADLGLTAVLLFSHANTTTLEVIEVGLTGCASVYAPERSDRSGGDVATLLPNDPLRPNF